MGTDTDHAFTTLTETTVPAPVTFRGSPAPRFWEMEDALLAYGLVPVGPTDLAQLMMIEYASGYGNDWFVVPLTLPVGSVTSVEFARRHRQLRRAHAAAPDRRPRAAGRELVDVAARVPAPRRHRPDRATRVQPVLPAAGARAASSTRRRSRTC